MPFNRIRPTRIRLEASSVCQLRCASCPAHSGAIHTAVGSGFLKLHDFRELLKDNPQLRDIELSNYGEIFLNPDLLGILEYAHQRRVILRADTGVNFNTVKDDVLEGLVKYQVRSLCCSIDGASEQSYRLYRLNGDFPAVIENIRRLNALKRKHRSDFPKLAWQFVVFGHNEHEIPRARELADSLDMTFRLKLSWDPEFSPVVDEALLRKEIGAASREEYKERFGVDYVQTICYELWNCPQVNWDGRVLGCCRNFWGDFGGNAFSDGLRASINNANMRYARQMLLGKRPAKDGIPCSSCSVYLGMSAQGRWLQRRQVSPVLRHATSGGGLEGMRKSVAYRGARFVYRSFIPRPSPGTRLVSGVHPLEVLPPPDEEQGWKPYSIFHGSTKGLPVWSCHASALVPGACPHPPHRHKEEELLILLSGEVDLELPDIEAPTGNARRPLQPGHFVYYPARFAHTLQTTSEVSANYLMFKWSADFRGDGSSLRYGLFGAFGEAAGSEIEAGFHSRLVVEGPTDYLRELHCHASALAAGQGYDPHADDYDVAIVVLEGELETLGERVGPRGVILYAAGEPHGMRNPGQAAARYLVFEFHGHRTGLASRLRGMAKRGYGPPRAVGARGHPHHRGGPSGTMSD